MMSFMFGYAHVGDRFQAIHGDAAIAKVETAAGEDEPLCLCHTDVRILKHRDI